MLRQQTPTAYTDDYLEDALQRMTEYSLSALPVVDSDSGEFRGSTRDPGEDGGSGSDSDIAVGGRLRKISESAGVLSFS